MRKQNKNFSQNSFAMQVHITFSAGLKGSRLMFIERIAVLSDELFVSDKITLRRNARALPSYLQKASELSSFSSNRVVLVARA
jgi:hypothetical protein